MQSNMKNISLLRHCKFTS